jgi:uncharacterized protein YbjQ (UPF0145 family)
MRENYAKDIGQGAALGGGYISGLQNQACEARQSAKSRMRQQAQTMRREADRLDALADALPEVLPEAADFALWALLNK